MNRYHTPVMLREVIDRLNPRPDAVYVDATLGTGGHSEAILEAGARVIGIDVDKEALNVAKERLSRFGERMTYVHANFKRLDRVLDELKVKTISGIIYDLGTNALQLASPERGFSLYIDGPLDMRMDRGLTITCKDLVNNLEEAEIREIIWNYGQDWKARRIARWIVKERAVRHSIETTSCLARIVSQAVGRGHRQKRAALHPATKTFQAFRIVVNDELNNLKTSLERAILYLAPGGRIVVISFHSLEDRIVKRTFLDWAKRDPSLVKILDKRPLTPSRIEVEGNPRARSARLRAAERIPIGREW